MIFVVLFERLRQVLLVHFVVLTSVGALFALIQSNFLFTHEYFVGVEARGTIHVVVVDGY